MSDNLSNWMVGGHRILFYWNPTRMYMCNSFWQNWPTILYFFLLEEAAEFFSEPDPDLIASARFQKLKLDFLVAVEKIRREAEITKARFQQSIHPPFPHKGGQQSCAIVPNFSGNSPSISVQSSIPEAESHSRTFPAVSTSLTTIQTTAGKAATSVATSQIYESTASKFLTCFHFHVLVKCMNPWEESKSFTEMYFDSGVKWIETQSFM